MHERLTIILEDRPGEVVRALSLIERRQFALRSLLSRAGRAPGTTQLDVYVACGERRLASLVSLLEKLPAVRKVHRD